MTNPLSLTSPRWESLSAHFGNAYHDADLPALPALIERWRAEAGTYAEEYAYEPLWESFLHQLTIRDVAYAVVPHIVAVIGNVDPDRRIWLLDDVHRVESIRQTSPSEVAATLARLETLPAAVREDSIRSYRNGHPPLPFDLAEAYHHAVNAARAVAGATWGLNRSEQPGVHQTRRHARHLHSRGWTAQDVLKGVNLLCDERHGPIVYLGPAGALEALRSLQPIDQQWFRRHSFHSNVPEVLLAFRALHSLAWLAPKGKKVDVLLEGIF